MSDNDLEDIQQQAVRRDKFSDGSLKIFHAM
jgi:hypothetical protein